MMDDNTIMVIDGKELGNIEIFYTDKKKEVTAVVSKRGFQPRKLFTINANDWTCHIIETLRKIVSEDKDKELFEIEKIFLTKNKLGGLFR